jgi:hypothetical protein
MPVTLRILLIAGALLALLFFALQIRKRHLQINYSLFWILLSALLLVVAIFPGIFLGLAGLLGFVSPANLVFLTVIFLLILHLFSVTLKLSKANQQIGDITQRLALLENRLEYAPLKEGRAAGGQLEAEYGEEGRQAPKPADSLPA